MLLTRSPLDHPASWALSFDLHVLGTPPAFILSQDQTLRLIYYSSLLNFSFVIQISYLDISESKLKFLDVCFCLFLKEQSRPPKRFSALRFSARALIIYPTKEPMSTAFMKKIDKIFTKFFWPEINRKRPLRTLFSFLLFQYLSLVSKQLSYPDSFRFWKHFLQMIKHPVERFFWGSLIYIINK